MENNDSLYARLKQLKETSEAKPEKEIEESVEEDDFDVNEIIDESNDDDELTEEDFLNAFNDYDNEKSELDPEAEAQILENMRKNIDADEEFETEEEDIDNNDIEEEEDDNAFVVNVPKIVPKKQKVYSDEEDMLSDIDIIKSENEAISKNLAEFFEAKSAASANTETDDEDILSTAETIRGNIKEEDEPSDDIDTLINQLDNNNIVTEEDRLETAEDLEEYIRTHYEDIKHVEIEPNEKITAPVRFIIEKSEEYQETVEEILASNNINIVNKSDSEKDAILERFAETEHVTTTLVNSGIYVTMTGAGTGEIIAMNKPPKDNSIRTEMDKLSHVCNHIIGSSVGKLKLSQLIKIVSFYDLPQLYYALYAATYPETSEFSVECQNCGKSYYININTTDYLLNPEAFEEDSRDIKENVTTYSKLLANSKLGNLYKKAYGDNLIIWFRHPTIENYLTVKNKLDLEMYKNYADYIGGDQLVYCIAKVAIRIGKNKFVEITDPNDIVSKVLSRLKDPSQIYEIFKMSRALLPTDVPSFGIKKHCCPYCKREINEINMSMDQMLFFLANEAENKAKIKYQLSLLKEKEQKMKQ